MAATIRVTCTYGVPDGWEWAEKVGRSFKPPHALIDGREVDLRWGEPTDIEVAPGRVHTLEVYFRVFDVLRVCTAAADVGPLRDGEGRAFEYVTELKDRYLNRGHLKPAG